MNYSTNHRLVLTQQHSTLEPSESTGETAPKRNKKLFHGFIVIRSYYNYYYLLGFFFFLQIITTVDISIRQICGV
jgi:hypothetical protein